MIQEKAGVLTQVFLVSTPPNPLFC